MKLQSSCPAPERPDMWDHSNLRALIANYSNEVSIPYLVRNILHPLSTCTLNTVSLVPGSSLPHSVLLEIGCKFLYMANRGEQFRPRLAQFSAVSRAYQQMFCVSQELTVESIFSADSQFGLVPEGVISRPVRPQASSPANYGTSPPPDDQQGRRCLAMIEAVRLLLSRPDSPCRHRKMRGPQG